MCFSPGPTMALLSLKLTARRKPKGCRARPASSTASGNHSQILHHPTLRTTSKFRTGELFRSLPASKAKGFDFVTLRDMLISCLWKFAVYPVFSVSKAKNQGYPGYPKNGEAITGGIWWFPSIFLGARPPWDVKMQIPIPRNGWKMLKGPFTEKTTWKSYRNG